MVELPKNYRSTQNILDSAYSVVKNNNGHPVIKLESTQEEGDKIELIENADEADEARMIVKEAEKYADKNEEVAVLYRTNAQSRAIEEELIRRRVPYKLVGGVRFYGRAEIKDLIAFLRLINNKDEEVSVGRIEKIGKRKARVFFDWLGTKNETTFIIPEAHNIDPTSNFVIATPPKSPDSLSVSVSGSLQLTVSWVDNAKFETGFRIETSTDGVTFSPLATLAADISSYEHTSLVEGTTYHYRVLAFNDTGNSDYSLSANAVAADVDIGIAGKDQHASKKRHVTVRRSALTID